MMTYAICGGIAPASVMIRSIYSAGVTSNTGFLTVTCGRVRAISSGSTSPGGRSSIWISSPMNRPRRELVGLRGDDHVHPRFVGSVGNLRRPDLVHYGTVYGHRVSADHDEIDIVDERPDRRIDDIIRLDPRIVQGPDRDEPLVSRPHFRCKDRQSPFRSGAPR